MKSTTRPRKPGALMARTVRFPSAPPRTRPSDAPTIRLVWRSAVARMIAITTAVTPTKNQGALWPMLNAPPEFVVNRNVRTPGTTSIGSPGRADTAQIFVIRSSP